MTVQQIIKALKKAGKPVSQPQVYRNFAACKIKPLGARQRPQQYPADTADRILSHFGLGQERQTKLVSISQLRAVKPKTKGK